MATKINQDYYGDSAQWISITGDGITGNVKTSNRNIYKLCDGDYYQGGDFDLTASPWGIGESSLSSDFYCYALSDNGRLSIQKYFNKKGNTPLFLYQNSSGTNAMDLQAGELSSDDVFRNTARTRIDPAVDVVNSSTINSTLTLDNGTNINRNGCASAVPITYYNYNKSRLLCDIFWYRNTTDNLNTVRNAALIDLIINPKNYENIAEVYGMTLEGRFVYGTQGQLPTSGNWVDFCPSIGGCQRDIPDFIKNAYYGENYDNWTRPQRKLMTIGYWRLSNRWSTTQIDYSNGIPRDISLYEDPTTSAYYYPTMQFYGQFSEKHQVFDDVSYHWEFKYAWATTPSATPIYLNDGDIIPPNGYYMPYCVLVIDDTTYNTVAESYFYALIHEAAFMGFPVIANRFDSTYDIPTDWIFLPVFNEHMITTGDFKRGTTSLELPNATWGDIFDDNMPVYDPEYQPPVPTPENEDSGDLSNAGNYLHRFGAEGLTIWAFYRTSLGGNGLDDAINAITELYLTDPDGNEKWQLDFKGTNPDEYIVSLMAFPLRFTLSESTYTFALGAVDFEGIDVKKYADTGFFTFGSVTVPAYGDFRDFAPYTTAELYIPFCGTCEIDMAFFAGRDLIVDMYYDIYTGSCAAAIYRYTNLGKTLYKTINGQVGVEIPLSAARMGDYQSTLHALETAQKQNDIRIATSVLGMGITAGATIATGGATLPLLAAGVASTMGVVSSVQKSDELNYQLEHTQPKPAQTTAASTQNNYCVGGTRCMLFIKRAHMDSGYNADVYGRTKGFACLLNNTVNDNSGLTVCSNIDTSDIPATADEINAIKQAFASGVII